MTVLADELKRAADILAGVNFTNCLTNSFYCTIVIPAAFLFRIVYRFLMEFGGKAVCKMFVKFTPGRLDDTIQCFDEINKKLIGDFSRIHMTIKPNETQREI